MSADVGTAAAPRLRVGLISDTHGLLRPEALAQLRGCDHIVHAGDIGSPAIIDALAAMAPLVAVRGNNDTAPWAEALPKLAYLQLGELLLCVVHDPADLRRHVLRPGVRVLVCGHSHAPRVHRDGKVLHVNPGSAGPRRFKLPIAMAHLLVESGEATVTPLLL
jgi:putative phosphoesterase